MPRKTYIAAIQAALAEEMRRDQQVLLIGEDVRIGVFAGTRGLHAEFGDKRVIDTPISELGVAGAGIGAAATGLRPVVDLMFGTFLYLAFDQIANQAASMRYMFGGQAKLPIVFMTQNGGGISARKLPSCDCGIDQTSTAMDTPPCFTRCRPGLRGVVPGSA